MGEEGSLVKLRIILACFAALALTVGVATATAGKPGSQVRGQGKVQLGDAATISVSHIAVNAWLDGNGVPHGTVQWTGGVPAGTLPTPDPWHTAVTSIDISGNTAKVCFVVTHAVIGSEVGSTSCKTFVDNAATSAPDSIDGVPIQAGNITVS
jgi:hypothetical protein